MTVLLALVWSSVAIAPGSSTATVSALPGTEGSTTAIDLLAAEPRLESAGPSGLEGSTTAIDELELSDEDLALLAALDAGTSSTTSTTAIAPWWLAPAPLPRPTLILPRTRSREAAARSLSEVFETFPTAVETARRFVPGDGAIIRGQTGHRVGLSIDGVPLHHALSRSRETAGWWTLDPWMLDTVVVERPGLIGASPRGSAGSIAVFGVAPPVHPGIEEEAEVSARSADRSTTTHLALGAAGALAAVRVAGGYSDHRPLRISTSKTGADLGSGHQRVAATARARVLGRTDDPLRISAGVDFDRLLNVLRTDLTGGGDNTDDPLVDRAHDRLLTFLRLDAGGEDLDGSLLAARQVFSRRFGPRSDGSRTSEEEAVSWFVRGALRLSLLPSLTARAGGLAELSDAALATPSGTDGQLGDTRCYTGFVALDLAMEWLSAYTVVALVRSTSSLAGLEPLSETTPLTQGGARLALLGPLGLRLGWSQGLYLPNVRDRLDASVPLGAERSLTLDGGPSLYSELGFLELIAFATWIHDAIEPVSISRSRLVNVSDVALLGVELSGGVSLAEGLRAAGVLTWTEGRDRASDAPVVTFPTVTGRASVRYDLGVRDAFLEAHVRGTSRPLYVLALRAADPPPSISEVAPASFAAAGVTGGVDLGAGLRLTIALENVFDTAYRAPTSLVPGAGVDLRASLSHAWR